MGNLASGKYAVRLGEFNHALGRRDLEAFGRVLDSFPSSETMYLELPLWHRLVISSLGLDPVFAREAAILMKKKYILVEKENRPFLLRCWGNRHGRLEITTYANKYEVEYGVRTIPIEKMNAKQFVARMLFFINDPELSFIKETRHNLRPEYLRMVRYNLRMLQHYMALVPGKTAELEPYPDYVPETTRIQPTAPSAPPVPTAPPMPLAPEPTAPPMPLKEETKHDTSNVPSYPPPAYDAVVATTVPEVSEEPPSTGEADVEADEDETECVICLYNKKTHAIVPCGHKALCAECSRDNTFTTCPICRGEISGIMRIFD